MMGPPGPPMGGRGGGPRVGGIDGAKWQRGLQPPPPPPGLQASGFGPPRGYGGPAITLHKTENRYQVCAFIGILMCGADCVLESLLPPFTFIQDI